MYIWFVWKNVWRNKVRFATFAKEKLWKSLIWTETPDVSQFATE